MRREHSLAAPTLAMPAFAGREDEVALAMASIRSARGGNAKIILIIGEAGMGKTRIAEEIITSAVAGGFESTECRFMPGPHPPLESVLAALSKFTENSEDIERTGAEDSGAGIRPAQRELVDALRGIKKRAEYAPQLLFFDDLHWADSGSLDAVMLISRNLSGSRVAVLCTSRPDVSANQRLGRTKALINDLEGVVLSLDALSVKSLEEILQSMMEGRGDPLSLNRLAVASRGNPLLACELLRTLTGGGDFERQAGKWTLTTPENDIGLDLTDAVGRELQRLARSQRDTLEAAAVIGGLIDPKDLVSILGGKSEFVLSDCRQLVENSFLLRQRGASLVFTHDLYLASVYSTIKEEKRTQLHRRCGRMLEAKTGDLDESRIAWHFLLGKDQGACLRHSLKAARHCMDFNSLPEALEHFERAFTLANQLPSYRHERAEALEGMGSARAELCDYDEAQLCFEELLSMDLPPRDRARALRKYAEIWNQTRLGKGDSEQMDLLNDCALAIPEIDYSDQGEIFFAKALKSYWAGDYQRADEFWKNAQACFEKARLRESLAKQLAFHTALQLSQYRTTEALEQVQRAARLLGDEPTPSVEAEVRSHSGVVLLQAGQLTEAVHDLQRSIDLASTLGMSVYDAWGHFYLALLLEMEDELDAAWLESKKAVDVAQRAESAFLNISMLAQHTHLEHRLGREGADMSASRLMDLTASFQWRIRTPTRALVILAQAESATRGGDEERCRALFAEAMQALEGASLGPLFLALTHVWFAGSLLSLGDMQGSRNQLALAAAGFAEIGNDHMREKIDSDLAAMV